MTETLPAKAPAEILDYAIDASALLGEGETLLSVGSSITVSGATKSGEAFTETGVTIWISEGTAGTPIKIVALLKTSGGRTFQRTYIIPYGEPVSLELAKLQCRILDDTSEDELITGYIKAAREWVERETGHILVQREITEQRDCFGRFIEIRNRPVISVDEVGYTDADGAPQVYAGAVAQLDRFPVRVHPAIDGAWPTLGRYGGVSVTYTAGYAVGEEPQPLVQAMLLLIEHWFSVRGAVNIGNIVTEVPYAVERLCQQYRTPGL